MTTPVQADARSAATPGPWEAELFHPDWQCYRVVADGETVCDVFNEPDATLIAQAWTIPALRAALEDVQQHLRNGKWTRDDGVGNVISAALALADGET